jgi:hypothetical protein
MPIGKTECFLSVNNASMIDIHRNNNEFEMWMVTAGEREAVISILKLFDYDKV